MPSSGRGSPYASRSPWTVVIAVVLVVPGTLLSIVFGAIGAVILIALALDYAVRRGGTTGPARRTPLVVQVGVGVGVAAAIGAAITLGAWII